jgi:alcohol dehydrogenase YqhD (iron-dependent ADH family)
MFETKKAKLAQYGKRIFNLEGTDDEIANEAINKTVEFFHKMGMDTKLYQQRIRLQYFGKCFKGWKPCRRRKLFY